MILFYSVSCSNCPIFLHDEVQHGSLSSSFAATYDQGSLPFGPEAAHADGPMVQQRPGCNWNLWNLSTELLGKVSEDLHPYIGLHYEVQQLASTSDFQITQENPTGKWRHDISTHPMNSAADWTSSLQKLKKSNENKKEPFETHDFRWYKIHRGSNKKEITRTPISKMKLKASQRLPYALKAEEKARLERLVKEAVSELQQEDAILPAQLPEIETAAIHELRIEMDRQLALGDKTGVWDVANEIVERRHAPKDYTCRNLYNTCSMIKIGASWLKHGICCPATMLSSIATGSSTHYLKPLPGASKGAKLHDLLQNQPASDLPVVWNVFVTFSRKLLSGTTDELADEDIETFFILMMTYHALAFQDLEQEYIRYGKTWESLGYDNKDQAFCQSQVLAVHGDEETLTYLQAVKDHAKKELNRLDDDLESLHRSIDIGIEDVAQQTTILDLCASYDRRKKDRETVIFRGIGELMCKVLTPRQVAGLSLQIMRHCNFEAHHWSFPFLWFARHLLQ